MHDLITSDAGGEDDASDSNTSEHDAEQSHDESRRRKRGKIPTVEECLVALANLAGAVAMGYLKPAQANPMRASYVEILRYHQRNESRYDRKGLTDSDVVELMCKDPKMFSMLEPFLTDEQIDMVMKHTKDDDRGQA